MQIVFMSDNALDYCYSKHDYYITDIQINVFNIIKMH